MPHDRARRRVSWNGMSSALRLARRGLEVIVLEAEFCGRHASGD
nr:FAD-dependent oxidoreductase [Variovorax paradoxus]